MIYNFLKIIKIRIKIFFILKHCKVWILIDISWRLYELNEYIIFLTINIDILCILHFSSGKGFIDGIEKRGSSDTTNISTRYKEHPSCKKATRRLEGWFQSMAIYVGSHLGRKTTRHVETWNPQWGSIPR